MEVDDQEGWHGKRSLPKGEKKPSKQTPDGCIEKDWDIAQVSHKSSHSANGGNVFGRGTKRYPREKEQRWKKARTDEEKKVS